jgi:hypothetical protein
MSKITGVTPQTTVAELIESIATSTVNPTENPPTPLPPDEPNVTTTLSGIPLKPIFTIPRPTPDEPNVTTTLPGIPLSLIANFNIQYYGDGANQLVFANGPIKTNNQRITQQVANTYLGGTILKDGVVIGKITAISARGANPNNDPALYVSLDVDPIAAYKNVKYRMVKPVAGGSRRGSMRRRGKKMSRRR